MNFRVVAGSVAGAVTLLIAGYLIFGILIISFMKGHTFQYAGLVKETPVLSVIFLSNLVMAFMLSFVFEQWYGAALQATAKCPNRCPTWANGYVNLYKGMPGSLSMCWPKRCERLLPGE